LRTTLQEPQVKTALAGLGFEVVGSTPQAFADFQRAEVKRWNDVIAKSGIQLEQ
jgi:tripartite-type tricarboxylate transporter receptor subunit TctC